MTRYKITKDQLHEMQFDAGVLCRRFDVETLALDDADIICATTGGISLDISPSYVDTGADIYMMDKNTAEMLIVSGWTVTADFTSLSTSADFLSFALGAADTTDSITPRHDLQDSDFADIWWIGDRVDGGAVAVRLISALSDGGFALQTGKNSAGGIDVHLTAHASLNGDFGAVPVEIYSIESKPLFDIVQHIWLYAYNIPDGDLFQVNEETGELTITEAGEYTYEVNTETGRMEVTKA